MLQQITPYVGQYYSFEWIRKNVLMMSDDDIKLIAQQNQAEPPISPEEQGQ
jgi:hypothetical protein